MEDTDRGTALSERNWPGLHRISETMRPCFTRWKERTESGKVMLSPSLCLCRSLSPTSVCLSLSLCVFFSPFMHTHNNNKYMEDICNAIAGEVLTGGCHSSLISEPQALAFLIKYSVLLLGDNTQACSVAFACTHSHTY